MRSVHVAMVVTTAVIGASSAAHADERSMVLSVGGMFGAVGDVSSPSADGAWGTRLSVAWERPLIEMPASRGYDVRVGLVPELVVGGLVVGDQQRADGYLGAGIRGELQFSQREMGLLRVSARGAGYIALRGLVVGEDRTGIGEFGIGEYFARHHSSTRIGYEINVLVKPGDRAMEESSSTVGLLTQIYVGGSL